MKNFPLIVLLIIQIQGLAQVKIVSIDYKRDEDSKLSFPYIQAANKTVQKKLNAFLQKEILDRSSVTTDPKKLFKESEFIHDDSIFQSGYTDMDYEVELNNSQILSLSFQFETMGAYPESFTGYYNFDLQTGLPIEIKNLFTPSGLEWIKTELLRQRHKKIDEALKEIDFKEDDYGLDSSFIVETFANCNEKADEDQIFLNNNSIVFYKGYCFSHVARSLDINLDIEFNIKNLEKYLTPYAKTLLLNKKKTRKK